MMCFECGFSHVFENEKADKVRICTYTRSGCYLKDVSSCTGCKDQYAYNLTRRMHYGDCGECRHQLDEERCSWCREHSGNLDLWEWEVAKNN